MTKNDQILSAIKDLEKKLDLHIAENVDVCKKTDSMYMLLITGKNGDPSFSERLRNTEKWITSEKRLILLVITIVMGDIVVRVRDKIYPV
jgi:hypothetical protein